MFQFVVPKNQVGQLVVKGVKGEFSNTGTGGNISRGDHTFGSIWSYDTRLNLFVKGVTLGISMICLEKPSIILFSGPFTRVYGLVMGVGYIWKQQPNSHDENL